MSAREWKPGDVAAIQTRVIADDGGVAVRVKSHVLTGEPVWMWIVNGGVPRADGGLVRDESVTDARPLVVIDPEDREQTARLADLFCEARWCHTAAGDSDECDPLTRSAMREALAAFANPTPPKPPEPTGLGAVVEDASGHRWVRAGLGVAGADATPWQGVYPGPVERRHWRDIAAVRVLSEGVSDA